MYSSKHPAGHKPRCSFASPQQPNCPHHSLNFVPSDHHVNTPACAEFVASNFERLLLARSGEKNASQPPGIGPVDSERRVKNARFVPAAWMTRIEAVVPEFLDLQN